MSAITTHVLDTSLGHPACGVPVVLEFLRAPADWQPLGNGATDEDGRLRTLLPSDYQLQPGEYRLIFDTDSYFRSVNVTGFYPEVVIHFTVRDAAQHYHVPLLLNPFGYSTYRGS